MSFQESPHFSAGECQVDTRDPAMYPLGYLEHIVKPSIASTVKLGLASDYPLELSYSVLGGHLRFFLAPRVEE